MNLPSQGDYAVTAYAYDTSDQQDSVDLGSDIALTRSTRVICLSTVTENLFAPTEGTAFTDGKIFVSGRVEDDQQIAQAQVAIRNGLGQYMSSSGALHEHQRELPDGVLEQPRSLQGRTSPTRPR